MQLKSQIDWNEIVPLLPKAKREDLYLEAVMLLSLATPRRRNGSAVHKPDTRKIDPRFRYWRETANGKSRGTLAGPGKRYILNKNTKTPPKFGKLGDAWKQITSQTWKNDTITYEQICAIMKGVKLEPSSAVSTLWSKRAIDCADLRAAAA
jgi:hypothetical protein